MHLPSRSAELKRAETVTETIPARQHTFRREWYCDEPPPGTEVALWFDEWIVTPSVPLTQKIYGWLPRAS